MATALDVFVKNYYENDRELLEYISVDIGGIVAGLKNAADNKVLGNMILDYRFTDIFIFAERSKRKRNFTVRH